MLRWLVSVRILNRPAVADFAALELSVGSGNHFELSGFIVVLLRGRGFSSLHLDISSGEIRFWIRRIEFDCRIQILKGTIRISHSERRRTAHCVRLGMVGAQRQSRIGILSCFFVLASHVMHSRTSYVCGRVVWLSRDVFIVLFQIVPLTIVIASTDECD